MFIDPLNPVERGPGPMTMVRLLGPSVRWVDWDPLLQRFLRAGFLFGVRPRPGGIGEVEGGGINGPVTRPSHCRIGAIALRPVRTGVHGCWLNGPNLEMEQIAASDFADLTFLHHAGADRNRSAIAADKPAQL